jgi:hypothetical protein
MSQAPSRGTLFEVLDKVTRSAKMARTNLYSILFQGPGPSATFSESLQLRGKGTQLPSSDLGVIEVPYRGRKLKVPGQRSFSEWTVTVMETESMEVRLALEEWMNSLDGADTGSRDAGKICDAIVKTLDVGGSQPTMTYNLFGVFPTNIGAVEMNFDEQTAPMEYSVTFQYSFHTVSK